MFRLLRLQLARLGLPPTSRVGRAAWYLLGLDLLLFVLQMALGFAHSSYGQRLSGWILFLSLLVILFLSILAFRWLKARLLWRLRNRLIVTYIFIGVIPAVLLVAMAFITVYLFAGQFANFVVTSELNTRLQRLEAVNAAVANELAARLEHKQPATAESLQGLRRNDPSWAPRQICAWRGQTPVFVDSTVPPGTSPFALASFLGPRFSAIAADQGGLYLRSAIRLSSGPETLTVIASEPLDRKLLDKIAADLGEITLYAANSNAGKAAPTAATPSQASFAKDSPQGTFSVHQGEAGVRGEDGGEQLRPVFVAGGLPASAGALDRVITFGTPLPVVDWGTGEQKKAAALLRVQTRASVLYARLFAALGDFATGVEYALLGVAIFFAIIELLALFIGTRLTRTVTRAVAQLYDATKHVNRGDFSHRITVKSSDQLATLANSFNSMTDSIEKLIEEQKAKQRLENELIIAQEVQAQLFPQHVSQLASLEVHGFCRPARTVSGDYYDFLAIGSNQLLLAVGDVSGKGISAALLMATIHSAVRAYSLWGIPILREAAVVRTGTGSSMSLASELPDAELSPGTLLSLLNHQLYNSTPAEKYATLFLGIYDGQEHNLTYSNAGHLPPVILDPQGSLRRLDRGGTVIGLFDGMNYAQGSIQLQRNELFLAYSDGVTEPENDFGEFGEERLIELVRENRSLPLARISEIVTAAVDDWIGAREQPDDVTLVLARTR